MTHKAETIEELQKTILELKTKEEKYQNLYENSLVAMFTTDMETMNTIEVNETGIRLFGYESKEVFLKSFKASNHFIHVDNREENIRKIQKTGEVSNREQEMKRLDGTHFWARIFIKLNVEKNMA